MVVGTPEVPGSSEVTSGTSECVVGCSAVLEVVFDAFGGSPGGSCASGGVSDVFWCTSDVFCSKLPAETKAGTLVTSPSIEMNTKQLSVLYTILCINPTRHIRHSIRCNYIIYICGMLRGQIKLQSVQISLLFVLFPCYCTLPFAIAHN